MIHTINALTLGRLFRSYVLFANTFFRILVLMRINPCAAELFVSIFHLFQAGIFHAISSFK